MGRDQLKFHKNELGLIIKFLMIIVKGVWSRKNDVEFLFFFFFFPLLYPANHNYKLGNYTRSNQGRILKG